MTLPDAFGEPLTAGDAVAFVGAFSRRAMRDSRSLKGGKVTGFTERSVRIEYLGRHGEVTVITREPRLVVKRVAP